jgi:hypothetical protein
MPLTEADVDIRRAGVYRRIARIREVIRLDGDLLLCDPRRISNIPDRGASHAGVPVFSMPT